VTRYEAFKALAKIGFSKARVSFSGGNDEGFVDGIFLENVDGTPGPRWEEFSGYRSESVPGSLIKKCWPATDKTVQEELSEALAAPVYDTFGSFAGEYYVSGEFVWDVAAGKVTYDGREAPEGKRIWEWDS
jgi:hypothetical protein